MNGLDGIAGGVALVAFAGVMLIAISTRSPTMLTISSSMVGALLAFLAFNAPVHINRHFRSFMGDAGSTLLGFMLAGVGLTLIQPTRANLPPVVILWLLPIPIFEVFYSTIRRVWHGQSPIQGDAEHFHHKLLKAGFSVRAIFILYLSVSTACVAVAFAAVEFALPERLLFVGLIAAFAVWIAFVSAAQGLVRFLPAFLRRDGENLTY